MAHTTMMTTSMLVMLLLASNTSAFTSVSRPFTTVSHSSVMPNGRALLMGPLNALTAPTSKDAPAENEDGDIHPVDHASTTAQFLSGLWQLIARGNTMVKGESHIVMFPKMEAQFTPRFLNLVTAHLDSCKDVCDHFGMTTTLVPIVQGGRVKGFSVKSYKKPGEEDSDSLELGYDPFWDDGSDWNYEGVDEEAEGGALPKDKFPDIVNKIPDDDESIIQITKTWVSKMMSDMGICPFTSGAEMAGLPMGPVFYTIERTTSIEDMYARYWKEVVRVEQQSERQLSTTLLIAPEFCFDNVEQFENWSTTLTQPLTALGVETLLQLVFFHPNWSFRDGGAREGEEAAANYARRSPWPMVNILRTNQVRAAQKGIPTGLVYKQNEKTLSAIGADKLETMLRLRDWDAIADVKVNRRDMEALRIAQDYQATGELKVDDTTFSKDATPAANRVERKQVEQGNLVNVILQALEKRLGKENGGVVTRLSGPETSATIMASDFLLQELDKIVATAPPQPKPKNSVDAAKQAILDDYRLNEMDEENEAMMNDVMFGRAGVLDGKDRGEGGGPRYNAGMSPSNFY